MSKFGEESYELQTAVTLKTATGETPAASATGRVHAASPTCCFLSPNEVEVVELEVEGLLKASFGKEVVTAEAQDSQQVRVDALDS